MTKVNSYKTAVTFTGENYLEMEWGTFYSCKKEEGPKRADAIVIRPTALFAPCSITIRITKKNYFSGWICRVVWYSCC